MTPEEGIRIGSIQIRYYGLIIVLAMLVAAWVAARLAKRDGRDPEHVWGALTWAIIPGIIFARLFFVLFPPVSLTAGCATAVTTDVCRDASWFLQNITNLQQGPLAIWSGGLNIFGAVIGGFLGAYIYIKRNKLALGPWLDIAAVALPLGQAIGRWANFINQELYGGVTNLPWGIPIDSAHRVAPYGSTVNYPVATTFFHPLFLYESLWSVLAFIILLNLFQRNRKRLFPGDIFLFYVIQYAVIRFLLEFIRVEVSVIGGINLWQGVSLFVGVGALVYFLYRHRPGAAVIEAQPDMPREQKVKPTEAEQPSA
ncbi:MAG: prolipoprotein diacylglyceryl transferase [Anaerolineaceae bacterium]|nr:prolipoprotein diacylglyceryl transferase [Anaerolineaceae bacterium]